MIVRIVLYELFDRSSFLFRRIEWSGYFATSWTEILSQNIFGDILTYESYGSIRHTDIESTFVKPTKFSERYLLASLRNELAADEVYQNFALKLVRGDFATADPQFGKFRSFVKTVLYRLIIDHHRQRKRDARGVAIDFAGEPAVVVNEESSEEDRNFQQHWRDGILKFCWQELEQREQDGGIHYALLRTKAENLDASADELRAAVQQLTGKELTSGAIRVGLHRARQKFSDILIEAIAASIQNPTVETVEEELISLNLKKYRVCNQALDRYGDD